MYYIYMHVCSCRDRIARCTMHNGYTSSNRIILSNKICTRFSFGLAHGSCSWPTRWTMTKAVSCRESNVHPFVVEYALCTCKIEVAFECGGRLAKSKLSNELECGGTYGMTYDTYYGPARGSEPICRDGPISRWGFQSMY